MYGRHIGGRGVKPPMTSSGSAPKYGYSASPLPPPGDVPSICRFVSSVSFASSLLYAIDVTAGKKGNIKWKMDNANHSRS
jgi:hypothetical protein